MPVTFDKMHSVITLLNGDARVRLVLKTLEDADPDASDYTTASRAHEIWQAERKVMLKALGWTLKRYNKERLARDLPLTD